MARRPLRFKEPPGITQRKNRAWLDMMVPKAGEQRERFESRFPESDLAPLPVKRGPRVEHADLEKHVLAAVGELLAVHPRVAFAIRQNSGAASYEAATGKFAPIWFHKWIRAPEPMKMADYMGATVEGRLIALECKRPSWTKPTDERERQQAAFLALVLKIGGIAGFITDARQVEEMLNANRD